MMARWRSLASAVGDDAGNDDAWAVAGEAFDQGGDRLALARGVDHQHHRQAEHGGKIGGRAAAAGRAVEQAHDALDEHEVGVMPRRELGEALRPHCPRIEIEAGLAGRRS